MRFAITVALLLLGACSSEPSEADRQAAVAEVEANQEAPPEMLDPRPIRYPDIEKYGLYGAGCNFAPDGGGLGAIALAMADEGYMKRGEEILRFAADKGSDELPYLARHKYDGKDYSFTLDLDRDSGAPTGDETSDYSGTLTVKDGKDRVVYRATGIAQCGA
ncbi:hypothetical protein [Qipengyuania soli]|uniref:Lipoprotein n=1 Tax=Qipengyuania soli TaxID=2782568 RepID=A0A7S8F651_9SPHN|nr:hypothetical protein [Qipengyuania soli]QPC99944.1 hypothetical protein IRL76_05255 [Qipengyuania soli]